MSFWVVLFFLLRRFMVWDCVSVVEALGVVMFRFEVVVFDLERSEVVFGE